MTTTYTSSSGQPVEIAGMAFPHLESALAKAIRTEERKHADAAQEGRDYSNPEREAEIAAMTAEVERRNVEYAAQQAVTDDRT